MREIKYKADGSLVKLGDIVCTRFFFLFKRKAKVVYLPGVSKKRSTMEYGGLTWVGLKALDGTFLQGTVVDPDTGFIGKHVVLVERGEPIELPTDPDPFIPEGEVEDDGGN